METKESSIRVAWNVGAVSWSVSVRIRMSGARKAYTVLYAGTTYEVRVRQDLTTAKRLLPPGIGTVSMCLCKFRMTLNVAPDHS